MSAADLASGKGHRDENFPVASVLIAPRHRGVVLAFYRVARMADDIADHPGAAPADKLARLAAIERTLTGEDDAVAQAAELRRALAERGLTDRHILDLLEAFRRDATKTRYADWAELMDYCRYSAAPVGRFVLDVHGESRATWPASDALCAALQVINHLQDCGEDYRTLDRVYVPEGELFAAGVDVEALGAAQASPALRAVIGDLAGARRRFSRRPAPARRGARCAPFAGDRCHPPPGREPDPAADAPRPAVPEGASPALRGPGRGDPGRRRRSGRAPWVSAKPPRGAIGGR